MLVGTGAGKHFSMHRVTGDGAASYAREPRVIMPRALATGVSQALALQWHVDAWILEYDTTTLVEGNPAAPVDLLRLAVFGNDAELSALARRALAQSDSVAGADLIIETLDLPMAEAEQQALLDALVRLGAASPRARTIAQARRG